MKPGPFRVPLDAGEVTAVAYAAGADGDPGRVATYLFAHGAGAGQRHPYMVGTAERLARRGVSVVTFDFPYTEQGRKLPDPGRVLEACFGAVFAAVRAQTEGRLFAGGKSMGGRIASQAAARALIDPAGLVFLGYPLHPPGKPTQRRDKHLPSVSAPMLFVQGARDVFGTPAEFATLLPTLAQATLFPVEGGDHSHAVPKRGGVAQEAVHERVADEIARWIAGIARACP